MILADLRHYLQLNHRVNLNDLSTHFNVAPDALRGMLIKWINKGKVRKSSLEQSCGSSCCKCDPLLTEVYEWLDE
jgi:hypothetical protein